MSINIVNQKWKITVFQGRGGLGSIYVFATGNSGGEESDILRDSCAYDRLVSNKYVIAVAGKNLM